MKTARDKWKELAKMKQDGRDFDGKQHILY